MLEGALQALSVQAGRPAQYALTVRPAAGGDREVSLPLNSLLGNGLRIEFNGRITCSFCGVPTRRSYGEGHCYGCFRSLARCDLCVMSPVRCHYAAGTCREPAWGEAFCMQPHLVYLASSSGPKVGITRAGGQVGRWLDQGASQGLVVAAAPSRHLAGVLEARLARRVSDRTDWRRLLRGEPAPVDLAALRDRLRPPADAIPEGVRWLDGESVMTLEYPVLEYPARPARLELTSERVVAGRLLGMKGQYLLLEHGVLNVRRHRAFHVHVSVYDADDPIHSRSAEPAPRSTQMELFS